MYIREIAKTLYQLKRRLEELEREWAASSRRSGEERATLERELREVRAEHQRVKNILEGAKESPADSGR
jgi:chromosome segregation ATPase